MSRVVIVARTRMHGDHVCVGGHDLDHGFRGVRLLDRFGGRWSSDAPFRVGEVWDMRYIEKVCRPPHLEDVAVMDYRQLELVADLKRLVLRNVHPWAGALGTLFNGTVRTTPSGTAYIPARAKLPQCSTGYWLSTEDLEELRVGERVRFVSAGTDAIRQLAWVGVQRPPRTIGAGSLVRLSLSRLFGSTTAPEGYYLQISGVL